MFFSVRLRRLDIKATARTARSPGTARCSPPVPMRSLRAPLALRKASPAGPDEAPHTKRKKKAQVTGYVTWGFSEPPVGFEPTTYALQVRERSCRPVPRGAAS